VAQPKFTLYKHIKIDGQWRYCRAAVASNNKVKPHMVLVGGQEEKHEDGSYCVRHKDTWIDVTNDPAEALRRRTKMSGQESPVQQTAPAGTGIPLAEAVETYFKNLENRGVDAESIRCYRSGVDPFVKYCKKATVEEVKKQDLLDFMGWMRKQPLPKRRHSNPNRTYNNKVSYVAIFLKEFGVSRLLKKKEYPQYHKKKVVAHPENELSVLYGHANEKERFLLDFFIGSMVRDHEAYGCCYSDLTGTTLTIRGKQHKTRTVEIIPGSPMRSTSAGNTANPNTCSRIDTVVPTPTCFTNCKVSPAGRRRSSIASFTS
jgi:integrase/recombinase XerD